MWALIWREIWILKTAFCDFYYCFFSFRRYSARGRPGNGARIRKGQPIHPNTKPHANFTRLRPWKNFEVRWRTPRLPTTGLQRRRSSAHSAMYTVNTTILNNFKIKKKIFVLDPPQPLPNPIDKFGFSIGKLGVISLEIQANPAPHLEWTVRDEKIVEGSTDRSGRIEAASVKDLVRLLQLIFILIFTIFRFFFF